MKERLKRAWIKTVRFLFWLLMTVLCCCMLYLLFVHRRVIVAAIKGAPLPEPPEGKCCHRFCKKYKK